MRIPGIPFHQGRNDYTDGDGRHYGFAIHNTSNTASDENEASYADHRTDGTSSHFYVDADSVIQSLDTDAKAGHAGSRYGNENAIAFEITGTNDKSRQWWLDNVAWDRLGYVIAYILQHDPDYAGFQVRRANVSEMRTNPSVKAFYSHDDMRQAWGGTDHTDPGPGFAWDRLFSAVNAALGGGDDMDAKQDERLKNVDTWLRQLVELEDQVPLLNEGKTSNWPNKLGAVVKGLAADVADLKSAVAAQQAGQVSQATVSAAVAVALADSVVVAGLVKAINDDAARRQAE